MEASPEYYSHIIDYLSGSMCDAEIETLTSIINQSDESKKQFEHIQRCWNKEVKADEFSHTAQCWKQFIDKIELEKKNKKRRLFVITSLAATVLIFFTIVSFWSIYKPINNLSNTLNDSYKIDTLSDGTIVYLYPSSSLKAEPENNSYELCGSAFFVVPPQKSNPLIISLEHSEIKVMGTTFRVMNSQNQQILLSVESGMVEWTAENRNLKPLRITAGEEAVQSEENNLWVKGLKKEDIYVIYQPNRKSQ